MIDSVIKLYYLKSLESVTLKFVNFRKSENFRIG